MGTLTFPTLIGCAAPSVCYSSDNDVSSVNATGLVFTNTTGGYDIVGNDLTLGTGGIMDTVGGPAGNMIGIPIVLPARRQHDGQRP